MNFQKQLDPFHDIKQEIKRLSSTPDPKLHMSQELFEMLLNCEDNSHKSNIPAGTSMRGIPIVIAGSSSSYPQKHSSSSYRPKQQYNHRDIYKLKNK